MKPTMISLVLSLPAALLLGTTALVSRPAARPPQGPGIAGSVAVVDIDRVLKAYPGAIAREKEFDEAMKGFRAQLDQLETDMKAKQGVVAGYERGTEEYLKAGLAFELARLEREKTGEILDGQRQQRQAEMSIDLYSEIQSGIVAFAKAQKLQLVLRARPDSGSSIGIKINTNAARDVLYYDPKIDQTDAVIKFLKQWTPKPDDK